MGLHGSPKIFFAIHGKKNHRNFGRRWARETPCGRYPQSFRGTRSVKIRTDYATAGIVSRGSGISGVAKLDRVPVSSRSVTLLCPTNTLVCLEGFRPNESGQARVPVLPKPRRSSAGMIRVEYFKALAALAWHRDCLRPDKFGAR